ncbi:hypothetical protein E1265_22965 [Streptomyces sp. 8K308]|uniref:hypothetical protein n=1 Tax=Streptomyces sp. 8K308 TaxID=2530388 RepID=UPI00104FBFB4|nr:hypothetical protein [Streptomyces sp. 8K308]TDC19970.1 hypothetical protein E1265_22965 [Streptomyces sp. 8K308]
MIDRHRFEPARLLLGIGLLLVAVAHLERALGDDESLPLPVLLALPGVVLLVAAAVAVGTLMVRHSRRRRRDAEAPAETAPEPEFVSQTR